jgi:hypothetical protein
MIGDRIMSILRSACSRGSLAVLLLVVVCTGARPADDKAEWRKKALELNTITGDSAAEGQIELLRKDSAMTRKLLEVAGEMAKDRKTQPFNSNATYILARAAQELKMVEISQTFYEIQIDQIAKLESSQKMAAAYLLLLKLLIDNGKNAERQKVFQKYLETEGDENADVYKARVERMMIQAMAAQGQIDEALKLIDRKIKRNPNTSWS